MYVVTIFSINYFIIIIIIIIIVPNICQFEIQVNV